MNIGFKIITSDKVIPVIATVTGYSQSTIDNETWTLVPTVFWDGDECLEVVDVYRSVETYACSVDIVASSPNHIDFAIKDLEWNIEFKAPPAASNPRP